MTADEHLRLMIGDLLMKVAQLAAELEAAKATIAAAEPIGRTGDRTSLGIVKGGGDGRD